MRAWCNTGLWGIIAACLLWLCCSGVGRVGFAQQVIPQVIEARAFQVTGPNGEPRAVLTCDAAGNPSLMFANGRGELQFGVEAHATEGVSLSMFRDGKKSGVSLLCSPKASLLALHAGSRQILMDAPVKEGPSFRGLIGEQVRWQLPE